MKSLLAVGLASIVLAGCAIVPIAPRHVYYAPRPVVVAPLVVVRPHGWWWRHW